MNSYRVVLRAYPKGPRREELFDTLTEGGRDRPTGREWGNLVRHGWRARLGRPRSRGVVVIAVLVAFTTGYLTAALATRIGWEAAPDLPQGAALTAIGADVLGGVPHDASRNGDGMFQDIEEPSLGHILLVGHDEDFGFSQVDFYGPRAGVPGDFRAWTAQAASRLAAAGWDVGRITPMDEHFIDGRVGDQYGTRLDVTKDGLAVHLETSTTVSDISPGNFDVTADVTRVPPWWLITIGLIGWLGGAAAGWLITGWVSRRTERASAAVRSLTREPVVVALVLATPLSLLGLLLFGWQLFDASVSGVPFWVYTMTYGHGLTLVAGALGLVSLLMAAFAGRAVPERVEVRS